MVAEHTIKEMGNKQRFQGLEKQLKKITSSTFDR